MGGCVGECGEMVGIAGSVRCIVERLPHKF